MLIEDTIEGQDNVVSMAGSKLDQGANRKASATRLLLQILPPSTCSIRQVHAHEVDLCA